MGSGVDIPLVLFGADGGIDRSEARYEKEGGWACMIYKHNVASVLPGVTKPRHGNRDMPSK